MSKLLGMIEYTRIMIDRYQDKNMNAVDMTLGKGKDSFYLSSRFKKVYSFDIQQEAIEISKDKLKGINNVEMINESHELFDKYISKNIKLFVYNLGYLPGHDETITTLWQTTLKSLTKALDYLVSEGAIMLNIYTGHKNGKDEGMHIDKFINNLDISKYRVSKYCMVNAIDSPYVIVIHKK